MSKSEKEIKTQMEALAKELERFKVDRQNKLESFYSSIGKTFEEYVASDGSDLLGDLDRKTMNLSKGIIRGSVKATLALTLEKHTK